MRILDADAAARRTTGLVHLDTQRADGGLDLTVDRIHRLTGPGSLDFGGSEFAPGAREELVPELASPDDDYGWWELDGGAYLVRYNEAVELDDGETAFVSPLARLQRAGGSHPTFLARGREEPLEVLLQVGDAGCRLKENCRISRLTLTQEC